MLVLVHGCKPNLSRYIGRAQYDGLIELSLIVKYSSFVSCLAVPLVHLYTAKVALVRCQADWMPC